MDKPEDYIGKSALQCVAAEGADRKLVGVEIDGESLPGNDAFWAVSHDGKSVGHLTRCAFSPRLERNIGLVNVMADCAGEGTLLTLKTPGGERTATVVSIPWVRSETRIPTD